jgi:hypothetical protein
MGLKDLIERYGDEVIELSHEQYSNIVQIAAGSGPAAAAAIARDRTKPESRLTNSVNHRVLIYWQMKATGEGSELDRSELQLY